MKLVKMSLAAAVLLGASAFAIDNVKVSGDAKLFYTTNNTGNFDLFDKDSSAADTALRITSYNVCYTKLLRGCCCLLSSPGFTMSHMRRHRISEWRGR